MINMNINVYLNVAIFKKNRIPIIANININDNIPITKYL